MVFFGETNVLSPKLRRLIENTNEISGHYDGFQVNVCLNYGGRDEIIRAARKIAEGGSEYSEQNFSDQMYSAGMPDPDLIIRPGGEMRISNFLLWQAAYSELYFTDVLWPSFGKSELNKAIAEYQHRDRRYGGI